MGSRRARRSLGARTVVTVGALAAAIGYAVLAAADRSVAVVVIGNVPVGLGIGLAFAALTNLVVHSVDHGRTSSRRSLRRQP